MFVDQNDKTIVFHPDALKTLRLWLGQIEQGFGGDPDYKDEVSRVRAIAQIITPGFGNAARVTPDTPTGSLFVTEYPDTEASKPTYVFGCVHHQTGEIGVHS